MEPTPRPQPEPGTPASIGAMARDLEVIQGFAEALLRPGIAVDELLWDVTEQVVARLGLEDCVVYMLDDSGQGLVQRAAHGPKNPDGHRIADPIVIPVGKGIVGTVAATGQVLLVEDTRKDPRYIVDDCARLSELAVPITLEGRVIGVIDSEHSQPGFFTDWHRELFRLVAFLVATRIAAIRMEQLQARALEEQARAREMLQSSTARIRAIIDTATEGIVTIDARGSVESFNGSAERMFGYRADEVIGRNVSLLMPMPYQAEHDQYLNRYLQTGERRVIGIGREVTGLRRNGTTFPIDLSVGEGRIGEKVFFTAIIRDITERKDMQSKLNQAERLAAVGELAAGVAHEVNNPINTIINCAQLLKDGDDLDENCDTIISEGERIAVIVRDLLQFARDDRESAQSTSIADVVNRTVRLVGENFRRNGIALRVDLPRSCVPTRASPQQLQQVLLNLLMNAKDAIVHQGVRQDSAVTITAEETSRPARGVQLTIRDNGPGVAEHLRQRLFEPFVTTKRAKGGTGLGLSISKSIVEGYGGTIELLDTPGAGAEFRIWLHAEEHEGTQDPED